MRHICYVTGTRADFGLMRSTLEKIEKHPQLQLSLAMTGMHLNPAFGDTKNEVLEAGHKTYVVNNCEEDGSRLAMASSVGQQIVGFSELFLSLKPSIILLLGDRGEMLAAATAALYFNIPVVHIHGGELSGTVDESIRHAISKLSHFHFVATHKSRERLIRMGEKSNTVVVSGAPGLDDILNADVPSIDVLRRSLKIKSRDRLLAVVFHPVVQDAEHAGKQMDVLLKGLPNDVQVIILAPNADAGTNNIKRTIIDYCEKNSNAMMISHLSRNMYLSLLSHCSVLIGNSSSGIIEAASFGTPVVNVGSRQANRERNENTFDVEVNTMAISNRIDDALVLPKLSHKNVYGDGKSGARITEMLLELKIDENTTRKCNAY